jgi:hypothetical protein
MGMILNASNFKETNLEIEEIDEADDANDEVYEDNTVLNDFDQLPVATEVDDEVEEADLEEEVQTEDLEQDIDEVEPEAAKILNNTKQPVSAKVAVKKTTTTKTTKHQEEEEEEDDADTSNLLENITNKAGKFINDMVTGSAKAAKKVANTAVEVEKRGEKAIKSLAKKAKAAITPTPAADVKTSTVITKKTTNSKTGKKLDTQETSKKLQELQGKMKELLNKLKQSSNNVATASKKVKQSINATKQNVSSDANKKTTIRKKIVVDEDDE